ncbi:MAG: hypothetical protein QM270_11440 [Bacillota bacterium]|nr:hypothetical protein [Bacillota bacterium]
MKRFSHLMAVLLVVTLVLTSCGLLPPTPGNDEILEAIRLSNLAQPEPLELVYEEMEVPMRSPGHAGAVLYNEDKSIQINYIITYDRKTKAFHVDSFEMYRLGEDGMSRIVEP